jgi:hypothetical protein
MAGRSPVSRMSPFAASVPRNIYLQQCSVRVKKKIRIFPTDASLTLSCSARGGCHECDIT